MVKSLKRAVAAGLTAVMVCSAAFTQMPARVQAAGGQTVLSAFSDPDYQAKPMVRWWFPDAWAGEDEDDMIEEHIQKLAEAGYGGVEITMLASGSQMNNDDLAEYGWGTENWVKLLKKALTAANKVEGGFTVDITLTSHWPTVINTIDPNDPQASKEIIYTTQKVGGDAGENISLVLPETKTKDSTDALTAAPFIFTDTLVDSYLVQVSAKEEHKNTGGGFPGGGDFPGGGPAPAVESGEDTAAQAGGPAENDASSAAVTYDYTYDYSTAKRVTEDVSATAPREKNAGVPDEAACEKYGLDYSLVEKVFGPAPAEGADLTQSFNGKMDPEGHRARMQDTQYTYTLDTAKIQDTIKSTSSGEEIKVGDYVLVNVYERGTGQVMSDGPFGGAADTMYSRTYVSNYFTGEGTKALTDYWDKHILTDSELVGLLEANGSCIFEDSIEAGTKSGGSFWSERVQDRFAEEYGDTYKDMLPLIVTQGSGLTSADAGVKEALSDARTGYQIILGKLYDEEHSAIISAWAKNFNYKYRAQCYAVTGQDICGSEMATDIPEGDNSSKGDGLRKMASVVNVEDKESFSMEAVTATGNAKMNWADVVTEVGQNYSDGVNHVVLHGTPYTKSVTGHYADWPGWTAFGNNFAGSYAIWRSDWEDMDNLTGYMARNQAVLQKGKAKVDLAFLDDSSTGANLHSGNAFQDLLDQGYSYNFFTEALLKSENAKVTGGVLAQEGPAYKALILNEISQISQTGMEKVLAYAQAGLPVIAYNCDVTDVYGPESTGNTKEGMLAAYEEVLKCQKTKTADTKAELAQALEDLGIRSDARYDAAYLEASHYVDEADGSDYYYLYQNTKDAVTNTGMSNGKAASSFKNAGKSEASITLKGTGIPYELDAWTGKAAPVGEYTKNGDGTVTVHVELTGGESTILALLEGKEEKKHAEAAQGNVEYDSDGNLVYKSNQAGTAQVKLSDGTSAEVKIKETLKDLDLSTGWTLKIDSYGPADAYSAASNIDQNKTENSSTGNTVYKDPSLSKVTAEEFAIDTLCDWKDIRATAAQLSKLGVEKMQDVAGTGCYTNTFTLPDSWINSTGAVLKLAYNQDMVASVTVNGTRLVGFDNVSDQIDIGEYLKTGENTIVIKLDTPMFNRMLANGRQAIVNKLPGDMGMTGQSPLSNGLTSVVLSPYSTMVVGNAAFTKADERAEEAKAAQEEAEAQAASAKKAAEEAKAQAEAAKAEAAQAKAQAEAAAKASGADSAAAKQAQANYEAAQKAADEKAAAAQKALAQAQKQEKAAKNLQAKIKFQNSKITLKSVKGGKKQAKVTWKKVTGASGYQVQYATRKSFKGNKTAVVKKAKATALTVKKLKSGRKYYVRVRAYKIIEGKKVYGKYSKTLSVKVK